ncbi:MAG: T9SS type A sorting domain-containing protein [Tannerellaceae bacterium]|jgi:hypothetical protein|nr:T9SS type A sorting domain-containing protein [Tannerellaceae bacterium]
MKRVAVFMSVWLVGVVQAQLHSPFSVGMRLDKMPYKESRTYEYGKEGIPVLSPTKVQVVRAEDGLTDTVKILKTQEGGEYTLSSYDVRTYSEDDKLLSSIYYNSVHMHDSLGSLVEDHLEYDALGRVKSWLNIHYVMCQDQRLLWEHGIETPVGGYPDIVEGFPVQKCLRQSALTVYDHEANYIAISREGTAGDGRPAWNDTVRFQPIEHGYIAERTSYDPGHSIPLPWGTQPEEIWDAGPSLPERGRYTFDEEGRLLSVINEETGSGTAYTYFEGGYEMEGTSGWSLTGSGTHTYKYFVREDGCLSEVVYPEGCVIVREVYEYIGFNDNPSHVVPPIPFPASNEEALSVVKGGLRLRLVAPTEVEVFQPTGRLILSRRLSGDAVIPLSSGVYLVRVGQTTRRIAIR